MHHPGPTSSLQHPGPTSSLSGPTATKLCEISDVSQKNDYFVLTLRKENEKCLITYFTPDGNTVNYFITDQEISLEQASYVESAPSLWKTNKRLNKWKFSGLFIGTHTFVGNGRTFKETVYPESENNIDDIPNAKIVSVEGNAYSIRVSPSFLFCLQHHKDTTIIKTHLSCQDCEMPPVDFSSDLTILTITKGREYLYPIRCTIPLKMNPLSYVSKLDATKIKKPPELIEMVEQIEKATKKIGNKGKNFPRDFSRDGIKYLDKIVKIEKKSKEESIADGEKFQHVDNHPECELVEPLAVSMGYSGSAVAIPWLLFVIVLSLLCISSYFLISSYHKNKSLASRVITLA